MIYVITIFLLLFSNFCAFMVGRYLGAKEGIDYCFKRREEELKK